MMSTKKGAVGVALGTAVALTATACGGGSSTGSATADSPAQKGGTLNVLNIGPQEHWDPQRMYIGADILMANRLFTRTLTTYSADQDNKLVPDLATDLGTMSDEGKTWKFTLVDTAKWQDGKAVTCEDVKYGVSRTFATDVITGGPNYALTFLDIPTKTDAEGNEVSAYNGPYKGEGQDLYDKAVSCEGNTITFKFKTPWADFNQATTFPAFTAFRKDLDKGAQSDMEIFSNGPYKLEGTSFDKDKGGSFVRNPEWDADSDAVRKAYPEKVVYTLGVQNATIYQRLIADQGDDAATISGIQAEPTTLPQIEGNPSAKDRSLNVAAPYVDYIQPNMRSQVFSNDKARQAFAMATNREAYATAYGGPQVMIPSYAMCNKELDCFKEFNVFNVPTTGDPEAAKKVLTESGLPQPVNITVAYRKRPTADKALAALKQSWDQAGFNVTLEGLTDKYYATIQSPDYANRDAFWGGWGADWPSGSTVIPPLFDGRINITAGGSGQDYGYFNDDEVNKKIDEAYLIADSAEREAAWGAIDEMIAEKGGVVPLVNQRFTFLAGSKVKNFQTNPQMGGYPDLATIAVQ